MRNARRTQAKLRTTPMIEALDRRALLSAATAAAPSVAAAVTLPARQVENLDRGLVALNRGGGNVYLSWRLLGLEPASVAFNVYRSVNGGAPTKLNATPIAATTDYNSSGNVATNANSFTVRAVIDGVEQAPSKAATIAANAPVRQYLSIPLQIPAPMTTPDGAVHNYEANDASVGDLDGDGEYEVLVKWVGDAEPAFGYSANMYLDAYKMNGTRLWRIDLGKNIKAGAQFMQFVVYDLDGDGKAEVAMNTADGAVSGTGQVVGSATADYRTAGGYTAITGPEYLTIFNGQSGGILANTNLAPARGAVTNWGDDYGHRANTFNASVAYLDGVRPSLVFGRGIYHGRDGYPGRTQIVAWDWRGGQLSQRWTFTAASNGANPTYVGQGNHNISVGDVDADGKDEIVWGAMTVDDNGAGLYSTRLGHGDALHLSDMDPSRPGLEVFSPHESPSEYTRDTNGDGVAEDNGGSFRDARTGEVIFGIPGNGGDVGRGVAMDIDPRPGYEMWTSADGGIWNVDGTRVQDKPSNMFQNFGVWWDGDLYREQLDQTTISDWRLTGGTGTGGRVNFDLDPSVGGVQQYAPGATSNNSTKATPALSGDILGDWREEVIWRTSDNTELRIFSTIVPATSRLVTLMHDVQYRESIAWQQNYYNQPPQTSFFLGDGMSAPPTPNVYYAGLAPAAPAPLQAEAATIAGGVTIDSNNAGFNGTGFANFPASGGSVTWNNVDGGAGGTVTLGFRNALGNTARTGRLIVNGVAQDITFASTGSFTTWAVTTLALPLKAGATNTVQLLSTGQDLANVDELQVSLPSAASSAPLLASETINDGAAQRSRVTGMKLTFDQPVVVDPAGVTLTRRSGGAAQTFTLTPSADGRSVTFAFAGTDAIGGSLADGVYDLVIGAAAVRNSAGQAMAARTSTFHRLFGDINGDRTVSNVDTARFRRAANTATGAFYYDAAFDYDNNGFINNVDLAQFRRREGVTYVY